MAVARSAGQLCRITGPSGGKEDKTEVKRMAQSAVDAVHDQFVGPVRLRPPAEIGAEMAKTENSRQQGGSHHHASHNGNPSGTIRMFVVPGLKDAGQDQTLGRRPG